MNDWYMIIALSSVLLVIIAAVVNWLKLPTFQKIEDVKQWLRYAVTEAEKKLKTGTGQLKLRMVYDMFLDKYPELKAYITFERFSGWVDEALEWLNIQLESNKNLKEYVYGSDN